jgi:hypothetical protein
MLHTQTQTQTYTFTINQRYISMHNYIMFNL